jgi:hypothetical protein
MIDDTESESLREEQGKRPIHTPAERMADVPLAPHSAGALGHAAATDDSDVSDADDREAARDGESSG